MRKSSLFVGALSVLLLTSCASMFNGTKAKVIVRNDAVKGPVTLIYDNMVEYNVTMPHKIKINRGYKPSIISVQAEGYKEAKVVVDKKFNPNTLWNLLNLIIIGTGIDAATGAITTPVSKDIYIPLKPDNNFIEPSHSQEISTERVSRDNAGRTSLESTIIRWYFDSEPTGARIFWRVISSVPDEVKNTNELWLGSTPFEETRSFNIQGLTYENSRDVQIEIKVKRNGYIEQSKRFNVRQVIDQQEISSFFFMVHE